MGFRNRVPPLPPPIEIVKPPPHLEGIEPPPPPPKPHPKKIVIRGLLRIIILSEIKGKSTYGAEIYRNIGEKYGLKIPKAEVYMLLRRMEAEGLIVSSWDTGSQGFVKRKYMITEEGIDHLNTAIEELKKVRNIIDVILSTYK